MTGPKVHEVACCGSGTSTRRVLITGGSGYLGFRLATTLAKQGIEVDLLDVAPPRQPLPPNVRFFQGSVADAPAVDAAFTGACSSEPSSSSPQLPLDAVFHVASYGMSGRELRDRAKITSVNVGGTRNVIASCLRHGVPRLVYVSTCNVIFVGRPIDGGDESTPYPPPSAYKDAYSATKAQAERLVREANGLPLRQRVESGAAAADAKANGRLGNGEAGPDASCHPHPETNGAARLANGSGGCDSCGGRLYTCCIRSTGIWGPGETRHQPRVIRMVQAGLFQATFGDPNSLSDWIHVENLVQILILAERALRLPESASSSGVNGSNGRPHPPPTSGANGGVDVDGGAAGSRRRLGTPVAAGQVYYASDGAPINNFLHFKPFIVGLGYGYPSLNVPFALIYAIAWLIEYAWPLLSHLVADPPLTRMEVDKCCIQHWFKIDKARRELGFKPLPYDRAEVVRQMASEGWAAAGRGAWVAAGGGKSAVRGMAVVMAAVAVVVALLLAAAYGAGGNKVMS